MSNASSTDRPPDWEAEVDAGERARVERALRWRLILGRFGDERLGYDRLEDLTQSSSQDSGSTDLSGALFEARRMDLSLEYIYDREFAQRAHRPAGLSGGDALSVPAWLKGVRELFPTEAVRVIERDALHRYGLSELVTDPEVLRSAEPTSDLLKAIVQFKHLMKGDVRVAAREVVAKVVDSLRARLETDCRPALHGVVDPAGRPPARTFRNTDWHKTIRKNLKHWDAERQRLVAERIYFKHRQRMRSHWRIIMAVDQSGSMMDSLIHSAVMAAIFTALPAIDVHLLLWDHRLLDVSHLAHDPLEVLMTCQLGGGTRLYPVLLTCAERAAQPERTILVVVSDWFLGAERRQCLELAAQIHEAGVTCLGLCALDADARPSFDERFARELADCGWFVAALTPKQLAEHVGKLVA